MKISVLDLCMVPVGSSAAHALKNSVALAKELEKLGFPRVWYAEHHNMAGLASAATAVLMAQVAAVTSKITVGAGGIMLPNHSPLVIAEQFGTLAALNPERVELGLGRGPWTDEVTAQALRRNLADSANEFPRDVVELLDYFKPEKEGQGVRAVPGAGLSVPVWILSSGLLGAQLAARLGLPYAFASHFAPAELDRALQVYRESFQPSQYLDRPRVMVAFNAVVAPTDEEAQYLFSSLQQSFVNIYTGHPGLFPAPQAGYAESLPLEHKTILDETLPVSAVGTPETVRVFIKKLLERTNADELIASVPFYDPANEVRALRLLAEVAASL